MTDPYMEFLRSKAPSAMASGVKPGALPDHLFDFQAHCVAFCIKQGRAGLYLDTGLGKTRCELEWSRQCAEASNGRALILTPLAVARQFEREAGQLGYDAHGVTFGMAAGITKAQEWDIPVEYRRIGADE